MRTLSFLVLLALLAPAFLPASALADTVTLDAVMDTTLYGEDGTLSNGAGEFVFVGRTDMSALRRGLMAFDLSAIPTGSTITTVSLSLYCSRSKQNTEYDVSLHRLTASWGEAGSAGGGEEGEGGTAESGDATWTHRLYDTATWSTPGGDFAASASATTPVGRDGNRFAWTSAQMAVDVQAWLDGSSPNDGWVLIGDEGTNRSAKRFDGYQSTTASRRPILTVIYTPPGVMGACCAMNGGCTEVGAAACSGSYQGDATSCSVIMCPLPTGACCASDGMCSVQTAATCSGNYEGDATMCSPNPCPIPQGACCASDGSCGVVDDPGSACVGTYLGATTSCAPNPCMASIGACCAVDGSCSITDHPGGSCAGTYQGIDTTCAPGTCPQPTGACCATDGGCAETTSASCSGTWQGSSSSCMPNDCPQPTGACCDVGGGCAVSTAAACSGAYQGDGASCSPNPCPLPSGACCAMDGSCTTATAATCAGAFEGGMTSCGPNPCPQPTGACCAVGGGCADVTAASCADVYLGDASACADGCPLLLTPYVDALPRPGVATPTSGTAGGAAEYSIAIRQITQRLHRDLPETTLWVYDDGTGGSFPGPTIEARTDEPVRVVWTNDLREPTSGALRTNHILSVDTCPHGAGRGETRAVTHLHGGHVQAEFDGNPDDTIAPGESVAYDYPNWQDASTLWYHDHALGITRLNVYAGLAALYVIRDAEEDALGLPSGDYEVPLVVQDRQLASDGSLTYPAAWQEHFFGDVNLVNGKVWPFFDVDRGVYRFRILNGANSRTYTFALTEGLDFTIIGVDGGLLDSPRVASEITLGPAERADVLVDFSSLAAGTEVYLQNSAPAPFPGTPGEGVLPDVMQFRVGASAGLPFTAPSTLRTLPTLAESDATMTRDFELRRDGGDECGGRAAWLINGLGWDDITETPALGTTEIWRFVNRSGVSHPMHMHLVFFQVLDRQDFELVGGAVSPIGVPRAPEPWEAGEKDTVMVGPNEIVRVVARFTDFVGLFPYHCHILEHEDHEMMRQFQTTTVCGDGARGLPDEQCDDGNTTSGDGCSATCAIEPDVDGGPPAMDGAVAMPDGAVAMPDGAVAMPDGAVVAMDGGPPAVDDAGNPSRLDAGLTGDAGTGVEDGGCGCRTAPRRGAGWGWVLLGGVVALRRRLRRRLAGQPRRER